MIISSHEESPVAVINSSWVSYWACMLIECISVIFKQSSNVDIILQIVELFDKTISWNYSISLKSQVNFVKVCEMILT